LYLLTMNLSELVVHSLLCAGTVVLQCQGLKNPLVRECLLTSATVQSLSKRAQKRLFNKHGFREGVRNAFEHPPFARLMGPYTIFHRLCHVRSFTICCGIQYYPHPPLIPYLFANLDRFSCFHHDILCNIPPLYCSRAFPCCL
jgi:hypothetical protein